MPPVPAPACKNKTSLAEANPLPHEMATAHLFANVTQIFLTWQSILQEMISLCWFYIYFTFIGTFLAGNPKDQIVKAVSSREQSSRCSVAWRDYLPCVPDILDPSSRVLLHGLPASALPPLSVPSTLTAGHTRVCWCQVIILLSFKWLFWCLTSMTLSILQNPVLPWCTSL